jgi:enoyl-CoA hydratase/carnithine racemase
LTRAKQKDPDALYFFQDKFRLVQMIATLQTPYVAVLDGYACKFLLVHLCSKMSLIVLYIK